MHKPMDTDNNVLMARGKGGGVWVEMGKGGDGDICNNVNNKNKEKINIIVQTKNARD